MSEEYVERITVAQSSSIDISSTEPSLQLRGLQLIEYSEIRLRQTSTNRSILPVIAVSSNARRLVTILDSFMRSQVPCQEAFIVLL